MTTETSYRGARRWAALALALATTFGAGGCDDDIVEPPEGLRISGRVFYDGDGFSELADPALQVAAFAKFPPLGPPQGFEVIPNPVFTDEGIPYDIIGIPAFPTYQVVGQIVDRADSTNTATPTGAFPNFCQLSSADGGPVGATETTPTAGIDFTLYDNGGAGDPCLINTETCPAREGSGSLVVDVASAVDASTFAERDNVFVALFESLQGAPSAFTLVPLAGLEFPVQLILNDVAPSDYIVFACYDRNGDNLMDCQNGTGEGDEFAFYDEQAFVTVAADTITTIGLNVDTGASEPPESVSAQDAGCEL